MTNDTVVVLEPPAASLSGDDTDIRRGLRRGSNWLNEGGGRPTCDCEIDVQ